MTDIMLDLETLGTRAGCTILSIGATTFDLYSIPPTRSNFYCVISTPDCHRHGLVDDPATVAWWSQQSDEARQVLVAADREPRCPGSANLTMGLADALTHFSAYFDSNGGSDVRIWSNGADFDLPILCHAYAAVGRPVPWTYSNTRCFRTLRALAGDNRPPSWTGTPHNALDDALVQAEQAVRWLKKLEDLSRG